MRPRFHGRRRSIDRDRARHSRSRSPVRKNISSYGTDQQNKNLEGPRRERIRSTDRKLKETSKMADEKFHKRSRSNCSDDKRKSDRSRDRRVDNRKRSRSPIRKDLGRKRGKSSERKQNIHNSGRLGTQRHSDEQNKLSEKKSKTSHMKGSNVDLGNSQIEPDLAIPRRFDQTEFSINDRFSSFSITKPLVVDETISVEIERNIDGNEDFVIPDYFDPQCVTVIRRTDEGKKPFYLREEFLRRGFDDDEKEYSERRVVKVVSTLDGARTQRPDVLSIWDDIKDFNVNKVTDQSRFGNDNARRSQIDRERRQERPDGGRDRARLGDEHRTDGGRPPRSGIVLKGQDLRLALNRDRDERSSGNIIRRRDNEGSGEVTGSNIGLRFGHLGESQHSSELPDFSKRPGKYSYDAWKDKPELIPKGSSYFEHDNRDGGDNWEVNRSGSRGFYRPGRGRGRSSFTPRGVAPRRPPPSNRNENRYSSSRPNFDQWRHDKFEELEDNKPTSTTEK